MEKFTDFMVWTITTNVSFNSSFLCSIRTSIFRVDWSQLYDADHYKTQEKIYKDLRPTLMSDTLVVPTQSVRQYIDKLTARDYTDLKQQIDDFYRKNTHQTTSSTSVIPVDTLHHLQTYTVEVNPSNIISLRIHRSLDQNYGIQ